MRRARRASVRCSRVVSSRGRRPFRPVGQTTVRRMWCERSPSRRGSKIALGESPAAVGPLEAVEIVPGDDRLETLLDHLEHRERAAGRGRRAVDLHRHVGDLVLRPRGAVGVEDHVVVVGARLRASTQPAVVPGRSELAVLEERGDAVEIARVEPERVLVDERGDLVDVVARDRSWLAAGSAWSPSRGRCPSAPACSPASSIS